MAQDLPYGAEDLFVLRFGHNGRIWHRTGVGAGSSWLGPEPGGPLFDAVAGPWELHSDAPVRMLEGYYAMSAFAVGIPNGDRIVLGSRHGRLNLPDNLRSPQVMDDVAEALRTVRDQDPRDMSWLFEGPYFDDSPEWSPAEFANNAVRKVRSETAALAYDRHEEPGNRGGPRLEPVGTSGTPASFVLIVGPGGYIGIDAGDEELATWLTQNANRIVDSVDLNPKHSVYGNTLYGEAVRTLSEALADRGVHAVTFDVNEGMLTLIGNAANNARGFTPAEAGLTYGLTRALSLTGRKYAGLYSNLDGAREWAQSHVSAGQPLTVVRVNEFPSRTYLRNYQDPELTRKFIMETDKAFREAGGITVVNDDAHAGVATVVGYVLGDKDHSSAVVAALQEELTQRYPVQLEAPRRKTEPEGFIHFAVTSAHIPASDSTPTLTAARNLLDQAETQAAEAMEQAIAERMPPMPRRLGGWVRPGRPQPNKVRTTFGNPAADRRRQNRWS